MIGNVDDLMTAAGVTPIPVASTNVVYTPSIPIKHIDRMGLRLLGAKSSGTLDLLVQLEVGMNPPTTEGASDSNWSIPSGYSDLVNIVTTTLWQKEVSLPPFPYCRLKITGQGANPASATIAGKIFKQGKT